MPKKLIDDIESVILTEIAAFPDGIGVDLLSSMLSSVMSRRTLQRRVTELAQSERIIRNGRGRAVRYRIYGRAEQGRDTPLRVADVHGEISYVPVSDEGQHVLDRVRLPLHQRDYVSYNRSFLSAYHPNETFYLSESLRADLFRIGRSHLQDRPAGTYARSILPRLLIDLSWASSRLEGNTYSLLDTQKLIEHGQAAVGKERREANMILNHKSAIEFIVKMADRIECDPATILHLHAILSKKLLADTANCGRMRQMPVDISGTTYLPLDVPQQIEELFSEVLEKARAIEDPFEQSFFLMVHLPYLQPFVDVNKRVSRLAANIPLITNNLCPLSFINVPQRAYVEGLLGVYELNRVELLRDVYVWAYTMSCRRYMALQNVDIDPDPVWMRYDAEINTIVCDVVRGLQSASESHLRQKAIEVVPKRDVKNVTRILVEVFRTLHEHNAISYGLEADEYRRFHDK